MRIAEITREIEHLARGDVAGLALAAVESTSPKGSIPGPAGLPGADIRRSSPLGRHDETHDMKGQTRLDAASSYQTVKPTHSAMNNATVFARAGQTLVVRHCRTNEGAVLFVLGDDRDSQSYCFTELAALKKFQSRLEHFLIETGWYLLDPFTPRSSGGDIATPSLGAVQLTSN
jgi:hypothetical protein